MKIFVDTNVILEYFIEREDFFIVNRLFQLIRAQKHELLMSVGGFYTILFLIDKYLRKEKGLIGDARVEALRAIMRNIVTTINVAEHDRDSLLRGIGNTLFKDIEDGCQYELALKSRCACLVTYNVKDYPKFDDNSPVEILLPEDFISKYSEE